MMNQQPQQQFGGSFSQPPQQQKGCWGRNWKWLVPAGCLGLILAVVAFAVGVFFIAMSAIKSSEVYQGALGRAQYHPAVLEQLGDPVKDGWWVKGNVSVEGATGHANFEIPISGPKKKATLYVVASKESGDWMYETLDVAVEDGARFSILESNILEPPPPPLPDADENSNSDEDEDETDTPSVNSGKTISGGVLNGKAISKPAPAYPPIAKAARAQGTVTVQVTVDESGKVISASAVSGHPLLQQAAVVAARQARFSPTLLSGKPVKVSGILTYNFVLE